MPGIKYQNSEGKVLYYLLSLKDTCFSRIYTGDRYTQRADKIGLQVKRTFKKSITFYTG